CQPALPLGPGRYIDVLFQKSGEVLVWDQNNGYITTGKVIFWVCDTTKAGAPLDREPSLITVFKNTGAVAAHPVHLNPTLTAPAPLDYYYFTKDGRTSGL